MEKRKHKSKRMGSKRKEKEEGGRQRKGGKRKCVAAKPFLQLLHFFAAVCWSSAWISFPQQDSVKKLCNKTPMPVSLQLVFGSFALEA